MCPRPAHLPVSQATMDHLATLAREPSLSPSLFLDHKNPTRTEDLLELANALEVREAAAWILAHYRLLTREDILQLDALIAVRKRFPGAPPMDLTELYQD